MKIQIAVILAGMGVRLNEIGQSIPKGFLQFGNQSIIEESIERLQHSGIQKIIIITGHLPEFYERLKERYPQLVTVHNSQYAKSGSLYSLYCARKLVGHDFLLLESALIYEQRALETVLAFPKDNVILLSGTTNAGNEVYVETSGDTIVAMSKNRIDLGDPIAGELVGISKISQPLFHKMLQQAERMFETTLKVDYESDGLVAVAQSYPIYYTVINDLLWAEIDDKQHLLRAHQQINISSHFKKRVRQ